MYLIKLFDDVVVVEVVYYNVFNLILKVNWYLEKFDIFWNGFYIWGVFMIFRVLEINIMLLEFNLSCNRFLDGCI